MSVVVAAHNQVAWLGEAIASVRAQTFQDWELVVVDDGSDDPTPDVVRQYADDPRVRCLSQARTERSAARNRGIAASSGRLVAFLDADDCWLPEKLARQVAALGSVPDAGLCYTVARFIDAHGAPLPLRKPPRAIGGWVFPDLMRGNVIILASVLVRRTCLEAVGGFDPRLTPCEDWDLWLRLARRYPVVAVDEELTLYRRHDTNTAWQRVLDGALRVIDKHYADPDTARQVGLSRAAVRARHFWTNAAGLAEERRSAALPLAVRALRESPSTLASRAAAATLATLLLPRVAMRVVRGLAS